MKNYYLKFIYYVLKCYAVKVIKSHNPFVVAVTGSVGKTSTKEAIYRVLYDEFGKDVRKNHGNLNAEIGIPLTILGYTKLPNKYLWPFFLLLAYFKTFAKEYPKYLIVEVGIEKTGDMKYLASIIEPDFAVITSTALAHIANFESVKAYQDEKISLLKYLKRDGRAILNFDDKVLAEKNGEDIVSIAIENSADYRAENIKIGLLGTEYRISCTGYKGAVKSKIIGKHLIYSQLFAFAAGDMLGISRMKIGKSLEKIKPLPGRMNLIEGKNNVAIIDDTYNANPSSVKAAIDLLDEIEYDHRKILILGNMNELGDDEESLHREVAQYSKNKFDLVVFVGKNSSLMAKEFSEKNKVMTFLNRDLLIKDIHNIVKNDDLALIKASQNKNYFEEVTKILMKNPSEAKSKLVRQDSFWKNKK